MAIPPEVAETIRRKKSQYCRFVDTKNWASVERLALPDAKFSFHETNGSVTKVGWKHLAFSTPQAFGDFFRKLLAPADTLHNVGPGDLEMTGPAEVQAIWPMEDQLLARWTAGLIWLRGGGYYYETWVLKDGDWFLQSLRLERTYVDMSLLVRFYSLFQSLMSKVF
ncbi:hypothetical protein NKR23_g5370 [Pleurostoma richardsiae]|uniref:SnoaL-like domain-containing protein n=1 Tax=Pleurostoma richardsiae TaxID=41990 RepID=A0AA38VJD6_9PEZI|nr:hypothetical protein NKR23_g5370 [Pleurostoma richardsiae]